MVQEFEEGFSSKYCLLAHLLAKRRLKVAQVRQILKLKRSETDYNSRLEFCAVKSTTTTHLCPVPAPRCGMYDEWYVRRGGTREYVYVIFEATPLPSQTRSCYLIVAQIVWRLCCSNHRLHVDTCSSQNSACACKLTLPPMH